jgi:hypothetical protein
MQTDDGFVLCTPIQCGYLRTQVSDWQLTEQSYPVQVTYPTTTPCRILSWIPPLPEQPSLSVAMSCENCIMTIPAWEQTLFSSLEFILLQYELSELLSQVIMTTDPK